nr:hypothetical protein [Mucilaginibacter sp. L294]
MFKWLISDEETKGVDFEVDRGKTHRYEARTYNHFSVNESVMNRCENNFVFEVSVLEKNSRGFVFDWRVLEKQMYKGMEYLGEQIVVLEKLAGIKDHLRLLIGDQGQIVSVLNKEEIKGNWLKLKENLYSNAKDWPIEEAYKDKFIADGDLEHSLDFPLEELLNQDPVFGTFFFRNTMGKTKEKEDALVRMEQPSNILMNERAEKMIIPLVQSTSWSRNPDDKDIIDFVISRNADKARLDKGRMTKMLKNFPFAEQEIKVYIYDYAAEYQISEADQMIGSAKYNLLEKVNHDLEVSHFCSIRSIN